MMWQPYTERLHQVLGNMEVTDARAVSLDVETGMSRWLDWTRQVGRKGRCLYLVGNGASASMAAHFAADMAKNAAIRTQWLTETSMLTAIANDLDYRRVFAEPLSWWMQPGDMLVTISSSGNSANILEAIDTARRLGGRVVTLSAMGAENASRRRGDLNFYLPAATYGLAESGHAVILHCWMDAVEAAR